jgi:hypothetical protein
MGSVTPSAMNWEMPPRPYFSPQLPVEGISGRAVNMDSKPISSLPQDSPILNEERINSSPLSVPKYGHNPQVDTEARSPVGCSASP